MVTLNVIHKKKNGAHILYVASAFVDFFIVIFTHDPKSIKAKAACKICAPKICSLV
jgi:hypothetical protein